MNRTSRTKSKVRKFLKLLGDSANVSSACRALGIPRQNIYEWRRQDPDFARKMDEAVDLGTCALEDEAIRRGMEGWDEPVYYKGEVVGETRRYSDQLLLATLRARDPKYRSDDLEGVGRVPIVLNVNIVEQVERTPEVILAADMVTVDADAGNQQDDRRVPETARVP